MRRAALREAAGSRPPDGALLCLPVADGPWAEGLPPVPGGQTVTVSFSSTAAAEEHGDALRLLGYAVVESGRTTSPARPTDSACVLVPQLLRDLHPTYWRSLAGQAERVYDLALGPVLVVFAELLEAHAAARDRRANG